MLRLSMADLKKGSCNCSIANDNILSLSSTLKYWTFSLRIVDMQKKRITFKDAFSKLTRSKFRFVNVFFGGHTVIFGNLISEIGLVSIVVVMGLDSHDWNDW